MAVLIINFKFFTSGTLAFIRLAPNMDSLVALGSGASYLYSFIGLIEMIVLPEHQEHIYHDLYFEAAAMILTLITLGKMLEAYAKGKTTDAIKSLTRLAPSLARVVRQGIEVEIDAAELVVGDVIAVKGGESIPADCIAAGNPCKVIRKITPEDREKYIHMD